VTYDEAVSEIIRVALDGSASKYVCACNVHTVSMARRDVKYRAALNGSMMAVPDGMPLVWAHRFLRGRRLPDRVYGPTLMLKLCEAAAQQGVGIYLYGGAPQILPLLTDSLLKSIPNLKILGAVSPSFNTRSEEDVSLMAEIEQINTSGAGIVFVALGAPKQELFMHRHATRIRPVQIGVGAAFNFLAGTVSQAPAWIQRMGLEWMYRFCCEPRRLCSRYVLYNPYFLVRLGLQIIGWDRPSRELEREMKASDV
jgi:N-acetylglucosaminyldiphosphoundecaprenol N-acetyl-beta-D-mannosaminyltransferase